MVDLAEVRDKIRAVRRELDSKYHITKIGVFGSTARGESGEGSDVDILVDFQETPDLFEFIRLENFLEDLLQAKIDMVREKAIRPEIRDNILRDIKYL